MLSLGMRIRYFIELAMIIPAVIFAVIPVLDSVKYSSVKFRLYAMGAIICLCFAQTYAGMKYSVRSRYFLTVNAALLSLIYISLVNESLGRKLFCLFNSGMLCEFCSIYAKFATAKYGISLLMNKADNFAALMPSLMYLVMSLPIGFIFWKTLTEKLPFLLNEEHIASIWQYMFMIPLAMTVLIWWITPISPIVIMTGRVRQIGLVLVVFVMISVLAFYYIFWWITARLTMSAKLQQENTFLQIESKRYSELKNYMNRTRTMRHDFRQHLLVIMNLTESEKYEDLKEYLSQFTKQMNAGYQVYCANPAVDALASHYDQIAKSQGTLITWNLELPSTLSVNEPDYCGIFGNLIENALVAVKDIPIEKRRVKVFSSMLSEFMLGISIDNPYSGKLAFRKNGLPFSSKDGHGIGLVSVMNTVNRYGGTMNIKANEKEKIFSVDIILYSNS